MTVPNLGAQPAAMSGQAGVVRKADKDRMALKAAPAIFTAEVQITRAATGKVEHYTITGTPAEPETQGA